MPIGMIAIKTNNMQIIGNFLRFLNGYLKEFLTSIDKSIMHPPIVNLNIRFNEFLFNILLFFFKKLFENILSMRFFWKHNVCSVLVKLLNYINNDSKNNIHCYIHFIWVFFSMNKKIKIGIILFIIIFLIIFIGGFFVYSGFYYHAEKTATDYIDGTDDVNVSKASNGLLLDGYGNDSLIIFYPGAKVEYTSYLPLFINLASRGTDCYLVDMPFNLAFLGKNTADGIIENSNYTHYFMSGHSLGGAMAGSYVNGTDKNITGLIYLSAHMPNEIKVPILSIRGTNDGIINLTGYNEAKQMVKNNFTEVIIDGGNHAQFGYYGNQSGDGKANITAESQQDQSADAIIKFIDYYT